MKIIGLNAYHGDSAACLVVDGILIAAAEEERFTRIKHWAGFPSEALKFCLAEGGLSIADVDVVAINSNPQAHIVKKLEYLLKRRPELSLLTDRLRNRRKRLSVKQSITELFPGKKFIGGIEHIEHHRAHMGSAFFVSPFQEACVLSVDGFGDFSSAAWGLGTGSDIHIDGRVYFPHSLGIFYQSMTQYLGFYNYGDEYKVMGLAPYGVPDKVPQLKELLQIKKDGTFELELSFFRHHHENVSYTWDGGEPRVGKIFSDSIVDLLGPPRLPSQPLEQRHRDIARATQTIYEEAFFTLLNMLYEKYRTPNLTLAGGCGMNSVANGKISRRTPFRRLYVQSAAGDAGGAIGAAFCSWNSSPSAMVTVNVGTNKSVLGGDPSLRRWVMDHAYFGPSTGDDDISALLLRRDDELQRQNCTITRFENSRDLVENTAKTIASGMVVGWFQGRMEWGPRALGNRSILCDPRRADIKDILNLKIKRRESFRPFAPSVLKEYTSEWFEEDGDVPFMMQVYQVRENKRSFIPAVTHVDGSGRLQTVYRSTNPLYWDLIDSFRQITSVPMVLNTSFNENEPIVCKVDEALDCFLRTKMDLLVIGSFSIRRTE